MMALPWTQRVVLERKIARWVWEEKRAITLQEIAERYLTTTSDTATSCLYHLNQITAKNNNPLYTSETAL